MCWLKYGWRLNDIIKDAPKWKSKGRKLTTRLQKRQRWPNCDLRIFYVETQKNCNKGLEETVWINDRFLIVIKSWKERKNKIYNYHALLYICFHSVLILLCIYKTLNHYENETYDGSKTSENNKNKDISE